MTIQDLQEELQKTNNTISMLEKNKKLKPVEKISLKNAQDRARTLAKKIKELETQDDATNQDKKVFGNQDVYTLIDISKIKPNPYQPRKKINNETLEELANSIKVHGVLQPIVVVEIAGEYVIIAGERRYKASQLAQKTTIPAIVKRGQEYQTKEMLAEVALIENLLREDMSLIDEAKAIHVLNELKGNYRLTAEAIGKQKDYIAQLVTIASFDDRCLELIDTKNITNKRLLYLIQKDIPQEKQYEFLQIVATKDINLKNYEAIKTNFLSANTKEIVCNADKQLISKDDFEGLDSIEFKKCNSDTLNININLSTFCEDDLEALKAIINAKINSYDNTKK